MPCTTSNTIIKGFFISTEEANAVLAVVGSSGEVIPGAHVMIDCGYDILTEMTDMTGCAYFALVPGVICDLTVEKDCYRLYQEKIEIVPRSSFNSGINFPFKLLGINGQVLSNVSAEIQYFLNGVQVNQIVLSSNGNGIYEAEFREGFSHKLLIDAGSEGSLVQTIETFLKTDCGETAFQVVPLIQLT